MLFSIRTSLSIACLSVLAVLPATSRATVVWNESSNGDLANVGATPTPITLAAGTNSIIGTVGTGDQDDLVGITVPAGFRLSSDVLAAYSSTDAQGFSGIFPGSTTVTSGTINTPSAYLGYSHYGTGATNNGQPTANLVGVDLLPLMANTTVAAGAQGLTDPLPAGSYILLIQQLGSPTNYQFDLGVTAAPEPGCLLPLAAIIPLMQRRRNKN